MRRPFPSILTVAFASVSCVGDTATEPALNDPRPAFSVAGKSGCHTVRLVTHTEGVFPDFAGTIAGDLERTVDVDLSFDVTLTGVVFHNPGEETWVVTGGTIPELIGQTIRSEFEAVTVIAPGQSPAFRINGRSQIVDVATHGNLTFHGTFDVSVFPIVVDLEYRGVICP